MDRYQTTIETFDAVAEQYWDKFKQFKPYEIAYDWFLMHLPKGELSLLEIACGPGNVSRYLLNKNPAINLLGVDLAPKMIELAKLHNPQAIYKVLDCRQITSLRQSFNAIMCGFCLPYISWHDSKTLIQDMASLLNPNGWLCISLSKGNSIDDGFKGSKSSSLMTYVHHHPIDAVIRAITESGLEFIDNQTVSHSHNDQQTDDVFIMAKKPS
jgi:2-polyprenyl-3-methyl-5-hydroxy-6-metoxy-1,4-benzoquinol methylase